MRARASFSGLVTSPVMPMPVCVLVELKRFELTTCPGVIEDAKFKRREALADLAKAVKNAK